MRDDDKLDLRALDPSRDRERWRQLTESVVQRAAARLRPVPSIPSQMVAWRMPVLAVAAALALMTWTAIAWSETDAGPEAEPMYLLSQWAARDELPASTPQILEAFRGHHDRP